MKHRTSVLVASLFALVLAASLSLATTTTAPAKSSAPAAPAKAAPAAGATTAKATTTAEKAKTAAVIDINSATKQELMKLPGIGDVISGKIIAGRPWTSKNQLLSKGVVNNATYEKIKDLIIAKQAAK